MGMEIHEKDDAVTVVMNQRMNCKDRRLLVRLSAIVESIKIVSQCIHAIGSIVHPIWVENRNYDEHEIL